MAGSASKRRVLVVGGGIGGLTAALCLARTGTEAVVFERASGFDAIGAGIQLSPNASRVLHHLGLAPALRRVACQPAAVEFRHWRTGRLLAASPLGKAGLAARGFPYYHIHRGDLLALLVRAAEGERRIALRTDAEVCPPLEVDPDGRIAVGADGARHEGGALVGADGIRSTVRAALFGAAEPVFTGQVAWRALVPANRLPGQGARPVATVWWGPGRHFVSYAVRGGALVNCVCVVEQAGWEAESWTARGEHAVLKAHFGGWHANVQVRIDCMDPEALYKWGLFDRPPLPSWSRGAATLLGDACHPTAPFLAQGAAMAIEDAAVLAACLAGGGETAARLKRYEALRRPRTTMVQRISRRNAMLFHLAGPAAWARNRVAGVFAKAVANRLFKYDALSAAGQG